MLQSMTGFGRAEYNNDEISIEVEIKTLNSKTLDLRVRNGFLSAENELNIRNHIANKLFRGKVDVFIDLKIKNEKGKFSLNKDVFEKYYNQFSEISKLHGNNISDVDFYSIIMRLPEVVVSEEFDVSKIWENIYNTFIIATENTIEFRNQEGQATQNVLIEYLQNIKTNLSFVPNYEDERIQTMRDKMAKAFDENNVAVNSERLEAELIFYLEKYDLQEEKTRLANHLNYFEQTMKEEFCGKKLGFISQEMGREINTLGSKANHFEIQKLVVQMKDELEKIKEQILNIL